MTRYGKILYDDYNLLFRQDYDSGTQIWLRTTFVFSYILNLSRQSSKILNLCFVQKRMQNSRSVMQKAYPDFSKLILLRLSVYSNRADRDLVAV